MLLSDLVLDVRTDLLKEFDCCLNSVFEEGPWVKQMLKDRLCCVSTEQVLNEELTDELDVTKKLVLAFQHDFLMVVLSVGFAAFLSFSLNFIVITLLLEDLLEADAAVFQELLTEHAVLKVDKGRFDTLRLEIDLDDLGADLLTVELGVLVLNLRLAENCLNDNAKNFVVDQEALGLFFVETGLAQ